MAKQRIIAITGASGGLAQEIVKQLSPSDGIILLGRDKDKLEKCYRHVENKTCLAIDLRDDNAIKKMVDYLYQRFGRIDVFINNAGLKSIGKNLYTETVASGAPVVGNPGDNNSGTIVTNFVEMSNVQVVDEMVNMIVAQRAYEMNSKAVTTADSMLEVAAGLKR